MEISWDTVLDKSSSKTNALGIPLLADNVWALSFVEACRDIVCLCHGGRVTYINEAGVHRFGCDSPEDILGRPFTDFVYSDDRDTVQWLLDKHYLEREPLAIKLLGAGRRPFDAETLFIPYGKNGHAGVVVQAHDISLRKERDERIQFQANYGIAEPFAFHGSAQSGHDPEQAGKQEAGVDVYRPGRI